MKLTTTTPRNKSGYTLIEIAAVIAILLALIAVLFVGVQGYLRGVNRANCVMNISNMQKAVRSYASMYGLNIGAGLTTGEARLIGPAGMLPAVPTCPGGGAYTFGTTVPPVGTAYTTCSLAGEGHAPANTTGW
jgi:prepilin-type N-terminal cleavage/methylation domain-containing protein